LDGIPRAGLDFERVAIGECVHGVFLLFLILLQLSLKCQLKKHVDVKTLVIYQNDYGGAGNLLGGLSMRQIGRRVQELDFALYSRGSASTAVRSAASSSSVTQTPCIVPGGISSGLFR
jgi:hypothetical protein